VEERLTAHAELHLASSAFWSAEERERITSLLFNVCQVKASPGPIIEQYFVAV
jgi:hypothetical protein